MYSIYNTLILLVDNDDDFLINVQNLLTAAGFQHIITANNCDDAIQLCKSSEKPYLIIMEYNFRSMTGAELIEQVKAYCNSIKLIVLSGSNKLSDSFKSLEVGALSFIHKDEVNWDKMVIDSVRSWVDFYKKKEYNRVEFRQKLKNLTVA